MFGIAFQIISASARAMVGAISPPDEVVLAEARAESEKGSRVAVYHLSSNSWNELGYSGIQIDSIGPYASSQVAAVSQISGGLFKITLSANSCSAKLMKDDYNIQYFHRLGKEPALAIKNHQIVVGGQGRKSEIIGSRAWSAYSAIYDRAWYCCSWINGRHLIAGWTDPLYRRNSKDCIFYFGAGKPRSRKFLAIGDHPVGGAMGYAVWWQGPESATWAPSANNYVRLVKLSKSGHIVLSRRLPWKGLTDYCIDETGRFLACYTDRFIVIFDCLGDRVIRTAPLPASVCDWSGLAGIVWSQ